MVLKERVAVCDVCQKTISSHACLFCNKDICLDCTKNAFDVVTVSTTRKPDYSGKLETSRNVLHELTAFPICPDCFNTPLVANMFKKEFFDSDFKEKIKNRIYKYIREKLVLEAL